MTSHFPKDQWIKHFSAETGIFHGNFVNTMAADALAPWVARPSTAVVLKIQDKLVPVFHKDRFQLAAPS